MDWKQVVLQDLKFDDQAGSFTALFAPFLSVDKQGDVTLPGAFGEQRVILSAYGHGSWSGELPVGKGRIFESAAGGIVEGKFFLDTVQGAETYKTVKNLGDLQEFSYALPEIDYEMTKLQTLLDRGLQIQMNGHNPDETVRALKKITVNEVSPVLMGAGVDTHLMDIKGGRERVTPIPLIDQLEAVASDAQKAIERLKDVAELREADGRHPGSETMKRALLLKARFEDLVRELDQVAKNHDALTAEIVKFYETLNNSRRSA